MKPLVLASIFTLQMQSAKADIPLASPPKPVTPEEVDAYKPRCVAAQHLWPRLSLQGKREVFEVEHRYYFSPADKKANYEVVAISAYDTLIRQENLESSIDEHSYVTGFLDCKNALDSNNNPTIPKKAHQSWGKNALRTIGALGYAANTPSIGFYPPVYIPPPMQFPTYIRQITPPNSTNPTYQVSSF